MPTLHQFYVEDDTLIQKKTTDTKSDFFIFDKEHIPRKNHPLENPITKEIEILFLKSVTLTIDSPFETLASLVTILNEIYYHNYTGIRFKLHDDIIKEVGQHLLTNVQDVIISYNSLVSNGDISTGTDVVYIYLGADSVCEHGLLGKELKGKNFIASNNFLNNPVLLAHEIGHVLKLEDYNEGENESLMNNDTFLFTSLTFLLFQVFNLSRPDSISSISLAHSTLLSYNNKQKMECFQAALYTESIISGCRVISEGSFSQIVFSSIQYDLISNYINIGACIQEVVNCEAIVLNAMLSNGRSIAYKEHLESQISKIHNHYSLTFTLPTYSSNPKNLNKPAVKEHLPYILNYINKHHEKNRKKYLLSILVDLGKQYKKIFSNPENAKIKSRFVKD